MRGLQREISECACIRRTPLTEVEVLKMHWRLSGSIGVNVALQASQPCLIFNFPLFYQTSLPVSIYSTKNTLQENPPRLSVIYSEIGSYPGLMTASAIGMLYQDTLFSHPTNRGMQLQ